MLRCAGLANRGIVRRGPHKLQHLWLHDRQLTHRPGTVLVAGYRRHCDRKHSGDHFYRPQLAAWGVLS